MCQPVRAEKGKLVHTVFVSSKSHLLFGKAFANFRRNLAIGHLVNGFNTNDAPTKLFTLKAFFEFAFGLAWAKCLNIVSVTNNGEERLVVAVEAVSILPIAHIL